VFAGQFSFELWTNLFVVRTLWEGSEDKEKGTALP